MLGVASFVGSGLVILGSPLSPSHNFLGWWRAWGCMGLWYFGRCALSVFCDRHCCVLHDDRRQEHKLSYHQTCGVPVFFFFGWNAFKESCVFCYYI